MTRGWYVAAVKPSSEDLAEKELVNQGFVVFNPIIRMRRVSRRGKVVVIARPYLPGYILIQFDPDADRWQSINGTRGVQKLFTCGDTPLRIREGIVEEMMRVHDDAPRLDDVILRYAAGDRVELTRGSFAGFEALVEMTSTDKVHVILTVFGRPTKTILSNNSLRPAR